MNSELINRYHYCGRINYPCIFKAVLSSQGVSSQGVSSQGVSSQGVSSQGVSSQSVCSQGVSSQGVSSQSVCSQGVSSQGVSSQGVCSQWRRVLTFAGIVLQYSWACTNLLLRQDTGMYNLRVMIAMVVIHQLDIRTCTAPNCSEFFIAMFQWCCDHLHLA